MANLVVPHHLEDKFKEFLSAELEVLRKQLEATTARIAEYESYLNKDGILPLVTENSSGLEIAINALNQSGRLLNRNGLKLFISHYIKDDELVNKLQNRASVALSTEGDRVNPKVRKVAYGDKGEDYFALSEWFDEDGELSMRRYSPISSKETVFSFKMQ